MGFYRFLLAIGVVAFHVGGGNWVIGRAAVFAFYFVSGFLICRVLDTSYRGGIDRLAAFYCNRALRLLPLYLVIVFLTILIFSLRGSASFVRLADGATIAPLGIEFPNSLLTLLPLPHFQHSAPIPMLAGSALRTMPQAWSIGIEVAFYVIAPILVLLARRHVWPLLALALAATAIFVAASLASSDFKYVENVVYKNAYTSAFMFFWGGVIYVVMRDTSFRISSAVGIPIVAAGLYYFYAWSASHELGTREPTRDAFVINILLAIPLSAVVCLTVIPPWLRSWESRLGDLSYGIYLNHFLVAMLLMWITNAIGSDLLGTYNRPDFGVSTIIASSLFAALTFNLVERPVEILRRKIKSRVGGQPIPAAEPASPITTSAV